MTLRLKRGDQIAEFPALAVRAVARRIGRRHVSARMFAPLTEQRSDESCEAVARTLAAAGIVARDGEWWKLTEDGIKLIQAVAGPPLKRVKAKAMLDGFIDRARALNADPRWPWTVTTIAVFGSYINEPEKQELGDLDVMYESELRKNLPASSKELEAALEAADKRAYDEGYRSDGTIIGQVMAGGIWFDRKLKGRGQRLFRPQPWNARWIEDKPHRIVFRETPGLCLPDD